MRNEDLRADQGVLRWDSGEVPRSLPVAPRSEPATPADPRHEDSWQSIRTARKADRATVKAALAEARAKLGVAV